MKKIIIIAVLIFGISLTAQEIKLDTSESIYTTTGGWHNIVEYDDDSIIFFFKEMEYNHDLQMITFENRKELNLFLDYLIKVDGTKGDTAITDINEYYPQSGGILNVMKSGSSTFVTIENTIKYYTLIRKGLAKKIHKKINK